MLRRSSFFMVFWSIATLGVNQIAVKFLVEKPLDETKILGSIFFLRLMAALVVYPLMILLILQMAQESIVVYRLMKRLHFFHHLD